MDYRIGLTTIFAPIDVQLLRASEFEARAAARFEQTCGDRSGRPFRTPAGSGVNPAAYSGEFITQRTSGIHLRKVAAFTTGIWQSRLGADAPFSI
jgi:hypothetical protein